MTDPRRQRLAFMACPVDDFSDLVRALRGADPDAAWHLVCFYPPPADLPPNTRVTQSSRSFRVALELWVAALGGRYRSAVVCCRNLEQPAALQSLVEFVSVLRVRERAIVDRSGRRQTIPSARIRSAAALAAVPPLLWFSTIVTRIGTRLWTKDVAADRRVSSGRTAIVVPILPDLSHTFVYREVLALKARHPDYVIVALERGDESVLHREARELLVHARFLPRVSTARYLMMYLGHWARRPSAMAATIRAVQPHTASFGTGWISDDVYCFLRLEHLQHSNYVTLGLVLADLLEKSGVTYFHAYGSTYPAVRALVAHHLLGVPFSLSTFVDFDYPTPFYMLPQKFEAARFVVACTEYCRERLRTRLPKLSSKFRVLHHALSSAPPAKAMRPVDGQSRVVYVGRFVPKKGLDTLVQAVAELHDRNVRFTTHLYGAGPEEETLKTLVRSLELDQVVFFEGPIANECFYSVLNHDDVFVCASRYMPDGERDGIPVTLMEAMAAGVTVVSTTVSGIPELVIHGVNGYLVAPDQPVLLADMLQHVIQDPSHRMSVREAAVDTIEQHFSIGAAVDQLDGWITRENGSAGAAVRRATDPVGDPV